MSSKGCPQKNSPFEDIPLRTYMSDQRKKSIRFYNEREVRAVWDNESNRWWFSVLDIVGAINEQDDYNRTRNY